MGIVSRSPILRLVDFYISTGRLPADVMTQEERDVVADLDERGMLEDPHAFANYLAPAVALERPDEIYDDVPPDKWLLDPYYVGPNIAGVGGPENSTVWPVLRDSFNCVFAPSNGVPISEVICTGSIGWGKSFFVGGLCMPRQLFELSRLRNPQAVLGITPGTPIVLVNLSVTGKQAKNSIFEYVKGVVDSAPYFRERFPRDKGTDSELRFPNNIVYWPGNSKETSAIGANVISGAIDEANFLVSAAKSAHEKAMGETDHALVLYRALKRRIRSRFLMSKGFRGRLFLCSSKTYEGSFLDQHVEKAKDEPGVLVFDYAQWAVRPPEQFNGKTFRVLIGSVGSRSSILDDEEEPAPGARIIEVPEEYRTDFDLDLEGAIRDVAGVSTTTLTPFLDPVSVLRQQAAEPPHPQDASRPLLAVPLGRPFKDTPVRDYVQSNYIVDLLDPSALVEQKIVKRIVRKPDGTKTTVDEGVWRPLRSPEEGRYVGLDLAIRGDAAGFAMGYVAGEKLVKHRSPSGTFVEERLPVIVFELLGAFIAPVGGEIMTSDIRALIYRLREMGFYISEITTDTYQSADTRQILTNEGFTVSEVSVDRDLDAYESLRSALTEGRLWYYPHAVALRELSRVQRVITPTKRAKIDHPARDPKNPRGGHGSKDVADAMAQVVLRISQGHVSDAALPKPGRGVVE